MTKLLPLAVTLVTAFLCASPARADLAPACKAKAAADRALHEHAYVRIGGIEQWLVIDGADCANPVVLFVHGGPGNPISPYFDELYGAWKSTVTIATWDQRLSGRTYARNEPPGEVTEERIAAAQLSIDLLVSDGIEVAEHLRQRLGHRKIILTGTSWGSVLGVHMAQRRPDLFSAYVGVSQLVNWRDNEAASYAATLEAARAKQDAAAITTLTELGAPPWTNPRSFGRKRRIIRAYENAATGPAPTFARPAEYASDADRAAYDAGEELSFIKYVGLAADGMAQRIDLPALGPKYAIPLYFLQGEADLLTRAIVTKAFVDSLQAPRKELVMVPHAGHDPNLAMIAAHLQLIKRSLPISPQ
jgi:pimeloyl-ACP methyl ester carboxylesterase